MRRRKPLVGLTGGVAAGKSTVAEILAELGAGVISSDVLAREITNTAEVMEVLGKWWGPSIFKTESEVDRRRISEIVFSVPAERERMERLIHPRVAARRNERIAEYERSDSIVMIVVDSPLLYESRLDELCDVVVFVDTDPALRKGRSEKARGWMEGELAKRELAQLPLDKKRAGADYICTNNSSLSDLRKQVAQIFADILKNFPEV
jgi:dephospho-CoA kinase